MRKLFLFGLTLLGMLAAFALLTPLIYSVDGTLQNLSATLRSPQAGSPLGTDQLGRDFLARLTQATRTSLGMALLCSVSAGLLGTLLAVIAGSQRGIVDKLLSGFTDICSAIPPLLQILLICAVLSAVSIEPIKALYISLTATMWVEYFRLFRVVVKTTMVGDAVEASRLLGFNWRYVLRRHLLPEITERWLILTTLGTANAVLSIATLGFISVGIQPPRAELGQLMTEGLVHFQEAPWLILFPVGILFIFVLALSLLTHETTTHGAETHSTETHGTANQLNPTDEKR